MGATSAISYQGYHNLTLDLPNNRTNLSKQSELLPLLHANWRHSPEAPYVVQVLIGSIALIVGFAGLIGNSLVISLFIRYKSFRRSTYMLILNLAVGDTFLILANVPLLVVSCFKGKWVGGVIGCHLFASAGGFAGFVSINTLAVIAVERYIVITCSLYIKRLSKRGVFISCACVWVYSFLWTIPPYIGWGGHMMEGSRTSCTFDYFTRTASNRSYVVSILVFCFGIQLLVIIISYVKILMTVFKHQRESRKDNKGFSLRVSSNHRKQNIEWRTAKSVLCLIFMFTISWMPYAIVSVIGQFGHQSYITPLSSALPGVLAKLSSVTNPIIYTLLHSKNRQIIWSWIQRKDSKLRSRQNTLTKRPDNDKCLLYECSIDCPHSNCRNSNATSV